MPKLSVIIPVYNAAPYLCACLDSILGQTLREIEVLCVDDGSTDESAAILTECAAKDERVKVFSQANMGQGAARNRALGKATGEYVHFMDADDELAASNALARLVEEMDQKQLDVLFFDAETRPDQGVVIDEDVLRPGDYIRRHDYTRVQTGRKIFAEMLRQREFTVSPCLMVLRRSFIEVHVLRFPAERIFYEDNIFMTQVVLAAGRVSHRPWRLYVRKVHAGSTVMSQPTLRHLRGYLACYLDVRRLLNKPVWDRPTRTALTERLVQYKLNVRRIMDANSALLVGAESEMSKEELAELLAVRDYPWTEKFANGWRCLRDHGITYTLRRILFGRQK